jgi:hypothetical protein
MPFVRRASKSFGGDAMLKYLLLGMSAALVAAPAHAQTVELTCGLTPSEQQAFVTMGYPGNAQQVMHLSVDTHARKVTVWETSPEFPNVNKSIHNAKFAGTTAAWTIGDVKDGPQAHGSVDSSTNVLTTVDPSGDATQWNCSGS